MSRLALVFCAFCWACGDTTRLVSVHGPGSPAGKQPGRLSISPPEHSFSGVRVTGSASIRLTVANQGSGPTNPLSVSLAGDADGFRVDGDCPGQSLAPSSTCEVDVTFTPRDVGARTASVIVSESRDDAVQAKLDGYGIRVVEPSATLSVEASVLAGGDGTIQLAPGGSCQAPCRQSAAFALGTLVRIAAFAGPDSQFRWTGACRGTAPTCELTMTANTAAGVIFNGANYVFITSTSYPANLGVPAYDAACNDRARAAGLPGPYVAWLSTKAVPASSRLAAARGFIRVDGRPFADTLEAGAPVYFPPALNEFGAPPSPYPQLAMTGSDFWGQTAPDLNCSDWTVSGPGALKVGDPMTGAGAWIGWGWSICSHAWPIYCMGTGIKRPLQRERVAGRLAFPSSSFFVPGGGLAAADSLCSSEARAAGLTGLFKALLAVDGASAASRFDLRGPRWVRPDGVPIVEGTADFAKGKLIAPIDVFASGRYDFSFNTVWAGARGGPSAVGTAADTCASWTSSSPGLRTSGGSTATIDFYWFGSGDVPCNVSCRLYCLQE